jgi:hypothetical protein
VELYVEERCQENIQDEEVIEEFFGQLWVIDASPSRNLRVRPTTPTQSASPTPTVTSSGSTGI